MSYSELIVKDDEFESASKKFTAFHGTLMDAIKQYKTILTDISTGAVSSGATHDALVLYMNYINALEIIVEDLSGRFETIVNNYISDLEKADDYLYDAGISNIARDFSQTNYEHLIFCLDDPWCSVTDSFGDWLYGKLLEVLNFFNADNVKAQLNSCHRLLLDYNDETKQGLRLLFDDAHRIDSKYGVSIPGAGGGDYYTAYFDCVNLTMYNIRDMLNEMAEIIKPGSGAFTVNQIQDRLGKAYQELLGYYNKTVEVSKIYNAPTIEEISDFASQPWAISYFGGFNSPISEYIGNIGGLEAAQMVLFEMFGITTDKLLYGGDGQLTSDEIIALLTGNNAYVISKQFSGDGYDVHLVKKQLLSVLQDMSDNYEYSGSDEEKLVDDCKTYLKYIEKYGDGWYEKLNTTRGEDGKLLLDGRTREAKEFKSFLGSLGNAQDILKYGSSAAEYLARLFADYKAGLEVIDSFERNYAGDETILKAVDEMRALYNKEFGAWAGEAFDVVKEHGFDIALKKLSNACPVVAVANKIGEGIDLVGELTGLGSEASSMYDSLIYHKLYSSSYSAYGNALDHFKAQTPGTEEYELAAKDLENCFNLHKNNIEEMYKAMAGASHGEQQSYYKYCAKQASLLSMKSGPEPDLLTFDEFCAINS